MQENMEHLVRSKGIGKQSKRRGNMKKVVQITKSEMEKAKDSGVCPETDT